MDRITSTSAASLSRYHPIGSTCWIDGRIRSATHSTARSVYSENVSSVRKPLNPGSQRHTPPVQRRPCLLAPTNTLTPM